MPPRAAALFAVLTLRPELGSEFRMAPGPVPDELAVNNPGIVVATFISTPLELWPRYLTRTGTLA